MGFLNRQTYRLGAGVEIAALTLLITLVSIGCAPGAPTETNFDAQAYGDSGAADVGEIGETEATYLPTMDGTWLHYSQLATCVSALIFVEEGVSRLTYIVDVEQDENRLLTETWNACSHDLFSVLDIDTYVTPALLDGAYPVTSVDGFISSSNYGGSYVSGLIAEIWGGDFDDPLHDPFPESRDDPYIADTDHDGNPGATILVSDLCQTYTIQRAFTSFSGLLVAPDRIEGTALSTNDQLNLGGSSSFCETTYDTRPNDSRSSFVRIRIDGQGGSLNLDNNDDGTITCDEVLPYIDQLFEKVLPDDANCDFWTGQ